MQWSNCERSGCWLQARKSYLQKSCTWKLFLHNHWDFHLGYHFTNGYFQLPINFDSDLHVANDYRMEKLTGPKLLPINISVRIYRIFCVTHRWNCVKMRRKKHFWISSRSSMHAREVVFHKGRSLRVKNWFKWALSACSLQRRLVQKLWVVLCAEMSGNPFMGLWKFGRPGSLQRVVLHPQHPELASFTHWLTHPPSSVHPSHEN